jgi:aspartate ammonia-lyase
MLVTALSPVIGYDEASKVAQHALAGNMTLREAALELNVVTASEFDRLVDPTKMVGPVPASRGRASVKATAQRAPARGTAARNRQRTPKR